SISQFVGDRHVKIGAGQESILSRDKEAILATYKRDAVGRRRVQHFNLTTSTLATSEISIITLMASSPVLSAVAGSKDAENKELTAKLLKMAACLQVAVGAHGNYSGFSQDQR
ncbi:MAG: hypothetical protein K2X27_00915, partial [Candidatus Obscuribacterales bacterium]|nr:hypothetical protein [Candidatus Obscuribacterales bacterium]